MKTNMDFSRRELMKAGLLGAATLALTAVPRTGFGAVTKAAKDPCRGLKLGMASYSLRKFTLDQAIVMTKSLGVKYITLKDMHLPFKTTTAERAEARKKIADAGLTLMGGGVIYMKNNPAEVRSYFDYANDAGMPTIVAAPDLDALDLVEKMATEYDLRVAIHNHGPGDKRYPSPLDVLRLVSNRDRRMGICMDVGHTVRLGEDPVEAIEKCAERLYDFHIKDETKAARDGSATEVGKGIIDIVAVLQTLVKLKFNYHLALEYEAHADAPMPGLIESYAYMRGILATFS